MSVKPKRGMRFEHARYLDPRTPPADRVPDVCTVTAVRKGTVYYRTVTGMKMKMDAENFPASVKRVLTKFHDEQG